MMRYQFYTADVFTDQRFGGNPLAVLTDARGLSDAHMQAIAREFNLSETAFVLPPRDPAHTFTLRIFTSSEEVPFAGHPTIGAALILLAMGAIKLADGAATIVFEEGIGAVRVDLRTHNNGLPTAELTTAKVPFGGPAAPDSATLAALLSLAPDAIGVGELTPATWSCGLPFLFVPLRDRATLAQARPSAPVWERTLTDYWTSFVLAFTTDTGTTDVDVQARMFASPLGSFEDPATGSAAAALVGILAAHNSLRDGTLRWTIVQGVEMGRPSRISLAADLADGAVTAVRVGGSAVLVSEGTLEV